MSLSIVHGGPGATFIWAGSLVVHFDGRGDVRRTFGVESWRSAGTESREPEGPRSPSMDLPVQAAGEEGEGEIPRS